VLRPFHVAIPVQDIEEARAFYSQVLGCEEGRSDALWIDFNLYGHQLVVHYKPKIKNRTRPEMPAVHHNPVDGHNVPVPHCGVVLDWEEWERLAERLKRSGIGFEIEPHVRFKGKPGEQATMFFLDPSGNALEFKAFRDINQLFAK